MLPIYFESSGARLFGMYHDAGRASARSSAVLICAPFGHEYIRAHRSLRQLATTLSDRGHHVLRFDYFGCGDSAGEDADADIGQWLGDITAAIDELKAMARATRVALVGLRLGATLAAEAAAGRDDVDGVFLWDPVTDGAAFVAELEQLQRAWLRGRPGSHRFARIPEPTELIGFALPPRLRRSIASLQLRMDDAPVKYVVTDEKADWQVASQAHAALLAPHMIQRLAALVGEHAA